MFFLDIRPRRDHQLGHRVIKPGDILTRCTFKSAEDARWFAKSLMRCWSAFEAVPVEPALDHPLKPDDSVDTTPRRRAPKLKAPEPQETRTE